MSIIRTKKKENPFVQLDKHFINDDSISWKAKGLLSYILSKPDDWTIRMKDLEKRSTDGETAVRSAIKELREKLYINRFRERLENGRFGDYIYEVYERPEYNPMTKKQLSLEPKKKPKRENLKQVIKPKRDFPEQEKPEQEKPEQENHVHSNNDLNNNDLNNNDYINNHHHYLMKVGFNKRQSTLIMNFASINKIKTDDDDFHILVTHLMNYKPNSMEYISKAYETLMNNKTTSTIKNDNKNGLNDLKSFWEKQQKENQKKSPEQLEREREEIDELLSKYKTSK